MSNEDFIQSVESELETLLDVLTVTSPEIKVVESSHGFQANISTEDSAILIGWHGETLSSLEYLLKLLLSCKLSEGERLPELHIDVGGYRQRHIDEIEELARSTAKTVLEKDQSEVLRPMRAFERRVVHTVLQEFDGIATESIGEEPNRRIVIKPKK